VLQLNHMPKLKLKDLVEVEDVEQAAAQAVAVVVSLTHDDLLELSPFLGRTVQTKDELFLACQSLSTVTVDGQEVTLEPKLLSRLKSRCIGKQEFGPWLKKVVIEQLHSYVGW